VTEQEAVDINKGLLALKRCMSALKEGGYVPYADSRLTLLLSGALASNSKTALIVTARGDDQHALETYQTLRFVSLCMRSRVFGVGSVLATHPLAWSLLPSVLRRFAETCRGVEGSARSGARTVSEVLERIEAEIAEAEEMIRQRERWVTRREQRWDPVSGQMEGFTKSVLTGAEAWRQKLERALTQRAHLLGVGV
jgi:hypothetical protein